MKKIMLLALGLTLGALDMNAQTVVVERHVRVRPHTPHYRRAVAPGRNYTYVKEDWTWNSSANRWDWNGNRWVEIERGHKWVPGHWANRRGGYTWIEGHWR